MGFWWNLKRKPAPIHAGKPVDWRDLAHPDLRSMTDGQFNARTNVLTRWWYPDAISWFGGAIRTWSDNGQGAYMTAAQAEAHKTWVAQGDIKIGPK